MKIKLSEYCKNNGISYITGYRWFKDGKLPAKAEQTESGTILVEIDEIKTAENSTKTISSFLKTTVEFANNNSTIEDFAAHVLSNYSLSLNKEYDMYNQINSVQNYLNTSSVQNYSCNTLFNSNTSIACANTINTNELSPKQVQQTQESLNKLADDLRDTLKTKKSKKSSKGKNT